MVIDRIRETFHQLMADCRLIEGAEFRERAGLSPQQLSDAVVKGKLFFVEVDGVRGYPSFYFDQTLSRSEIEVISKQLDDVSGGTKWLFFTTPKGRLATQAGIGRTPLEALRDGDFERVLQTAKGVVER